MKSEGITARASLLAFLALMSGCLLSLGYPKHDLGWVVWFVPAILLILVAGIRPLHGFLLFYLSGMIFFALTFRWILDVPNYSFLHHAILFFYLALYFGLFGLAFSFISKRVGLVSALFSAPFLWVSFEYLRSNMGFMAHPAALLGHSQYAYPAVIQIAAFAGVFGVSFLVMMGNVGVAAGILYFAKRGKWFMSPFMPSSSNRGIAAVVITSFALVILALLYGKVTLSKPFPGKEIHVALIQGNIDQDKKWNPKYAKSIMEIYAGLTADAAETGPAIIIWPEAATPQAINFDRRLYDEVGQLTRNIGIPLLLGSTSHEKFKNEGGQSLKFKNAAFLMDPQGTHPQQYDKIRLLPFAEYVPLKESIPWSYIKIPDVAQYIPGKEFTVFQGPGFGFGASICWESIFPGLVRQFVKNGAQFIVNITNEAWFGETAAAYQFLSMTVFRAVENRVFVVRCANTGVSCFIDPCGRVVSRVQDGTGKDIFVRGVLTDTVILMDSRTFYTRYGDVFAWLNMGVALLFLIITFLRSHPNSLHINSPSFD
jgi:apolipoprotein N-acyltransferase